MPQIAALRYKTNAIEDRSTNNVKVQREFAQTMIETGELPHILDDRQPEISFAFDLRPSEESPDEYQFSARARGARTPEDLSDMLHERRAVSASVEQQMERYRAIMRTYFPRFVAEGKLARVADQQEA